MTPSRGPAPLPVVHWTTLWATPFGGWLRLLPMLAMLAHDLPGQAMTPSVAGGHCFSAALAASGRLWLWGDNFFGQMGNCGLSTTPQSPMVGLNNIAAIAPGLMSMMALTNTGQVLTWGTSYVGALGQGATVQLPCPQVLPTVSGATQIASGNTHSLILLLNGTVMAFGSGAHGLGHTNNVSTPTLIPGLTNVVAIAAGASHSAAILADGTIRMWGGNSYGQLGFNGPNALSPATTPGITGAIAVACGGYCTLSIDTNGIVRQWGLSGNYQGSLPQVMPLPAPATAVASARQATAQMALLTTGAVQTWGSDCTFGTLGGGPICNSGAAPVQPVGLAANVIGIGCGSNHGLAVSQSGSVHSWGWNPCGELGYTAPATGSPVPGTVPGVDLTEFALHFVPAGQATVLRSFHGDPSTIYANMCTTAAQAAPHTGLVSFGGLWLPASEMFMWASFVQAGYPFATGAIDSMGMAVTTLPITNALLSGLTINAVSFNLGATGITHTSPVVTHTF